MSTFIVSSEKGSFIVSAFDKVSAEFKIRMNFDLHWSQINYVTPFNF
jgi:hypothetical protein